MAAAATFALSILLISSWPLRCSASTSNDLAFALRSLATDMRFHGWIASPSSNPCSWTGVSCDAHNLSVVALDLSDQRLSGFLSPKLGLLPHLQSLNLSFNSLSGPLPPALFSRNCSYLLNLSLASNSLRGHIPPGISNCSALTYLDLSNNAMGGLLPAEIGHLAHLQVLSLANNLFTTPIPLSLSNCTALKKLSFQNNSMTGPVPAVLDRLVDLESLSLTLNAFTGGIPASLLRNCTQLMFLSMADTFLSGPIPPEMGELPQLEELWLLYDNLTGTIPDSLGNLSRLTTLAIASNDLSGPIPISLGNLRSLQGLALSFNSLSGSLPPQLANLTDVQIFRTRYLKLTGSIPPDYGRLSSLQEMNLEVNNLSGEIPPGLMNCSALVRLYFGNNRLTGSIPDGLGSLPSLSSLDLSYNLLTGVIPSSISNCTKLQRISLGYNQLTGSIPSGAAWISNVLTFLFPHNMLTGKVPEALGVMLVVTNIDLSSNKLIGNIPNSIGGCVEMLQLNLSHNLLSGGIPEELATLGSLQQLDLSSNSLSGPIPGVLAHIKYLTFLNLSDNRLAGPIPDSGVFQKLNSSSFLENQGLCGPILGTICPTPQPSSNRSKKAVGLRFIIPAVIIVVVVAIASYLVFTCLRRHVGKNRQVIAPTILETFPKNEVFRLRAKDLWDMTDGFSTENLIAEGSSGMVYRGRMPDGTHVAVKRLTVESLHEAKQSFVAELQSLGNVRHRNLVRVLGFCAEQQAEAFVLELMPNGSLEEQLHDNPGGLLSHSWEANMNIVRGVAQALLYLHHEVAEPIVHCDIKPSNILLDEEMEAHVSDFGLARILRPVNISIGVSSSTLRGTIGYMAPEYASNGRISSKGDVYSFGMVMMEMVTRKQPMGEMFTMTGGKVTLVSWVQAIMVEDKGLVEQVACQSLLELASSQHLKEMSDVLQLALLCTRQKPQDRPSMKDVVRMLPSKNLTPSPKQPIFTLLHYDVH